MRRDRLTRLVTGLVMIAALMAVLVPSRGAAAQGEQASITIYKAFCPVGYTGDDFFEDCYDNPAAGITFTLAPQGQVVGTDATTDANGFTFFDGLGAGSYSLSEMIPGDFNSFVVRCSVGATGADFPFTYNQLDGIDLTLTTADDLRCDWYNIPEPQVTEQGSITIYKSTCPVGYTGTDYFGDCYANKTAGVTFTLFEEGNPTAAESTTDANGFAFFEGLEGKFSLTENIGAEFAEFVVGCTDNGVDVPLTISDDGNFVLLDVAATQDIRCDWYNIPFDLQGETPTAVPTKAPTAAPTKAPVTQLPNTGARPMGTDSGIGSLLFAALLVAGAGTIGTVALRRRATR